MSQVLCAVAEAQAGTAPQATPSSATPSTSAAGSAVDPSSQGQRPKSQPPRSEKAPELVAFEAGREVMDVLRAAHSHMCNVLEVISSDLGTPLYFPAPRVKAPSLFEFHAMFSTFERCESANGSRLWLMIMRAFEKWLNRNPVFPGTKFGTKPLERLLGVVTALLHRAYKLPYSNAAQTPPSLKKELAGEGPLLTKSWKRATVVARRGSINSKGVVPSN